ncbi:MAG TPA: hypothetical protein VKH44_12065 [Pirellulaceae bacterium]|nr:hypothetical protein [Pirellulaceae bacterium]
MKSPEVHQWGRLIDHILLLPCLKDRRRSAEAGLDHHLVKPPEPKLLEDLLNDLQPRKD